MCVFVCACVCVCVCVYVCVCKRARMCLLSINSQSTLSFALHTSRCPTYDRGHEVIHQLKAQRDAERCLC